MGDEIWTPVKDYETLYEISNKGKIRSLDKSWLNDRGGLCKKPGKILSPELCHGYYHIKLWKDGRFKWQQMHQLVAIAFIPNPENKPHVNHINSVRSDNRIENLEWCTPKENLVHASLAGRLKHINGKRVINMETGEVFKSCKEASDKSGINYQTLRAYLNGGIFNKSQFRYS